MEEQRREVSETVVEGNGVASRQQVVTDKVATGTKAEQVIWLIVGILEALLAIRFVLALLAANLSNGFAHLIFSVTYPFVAPFFGLFGYQFQYGVSHFEIETLVAMAVYALIGWVIVKIALIARR